MSDVTISHVPSVLHVRQCAHDKCRATASCILCRTKYEDGIPTQRSSPRCVSHCTGCELGLEYGEERAEAAS